MLYSLATVYPLQMTGRQTDGQMDGPTTTRANSSIFMDVRSAKNCNLNAV